MSENMNMIKNEEFTSKYNLVTRLLADPFDVMDDRNWGGELTEEEFFDENSGFFVDPITECNNLEQKERVIGFIEELVNIRKTLKLSYIVGSPGCGKTTFLHYILRKRKDDKTPIRGVVFDMFASVGLSMRLCQRTITSSEIGLKLEKNSTRYKFLSVLLDKVNEVLDYSHTSFYLDNDINGYRDSITTIVKNYCSRFADGCPSHMTNVYTPFFGALKDLVCKYKSINDINEHYDALRQVLLKCYWDESTEKDDPYGEFSCFILSLLTLLKICEVDDDAYKNRRYKYIYAVDNIEYFINQDAVFDKDISEIETIMISFNRFFKKELDDTNLEFKKRSPFLGHFKTVLVLRDSTNFLDVYKPGNAQEDDIQEEAYIKIELTKMFPLESIIKKRVERFKERNRVKSEIELEICNVICDVVSDETYTDNSSKRALESMYNHNKRRTIIYLNKIFKEEDVRQEYKRLQECCKHFNEPEISAARIKHGYRSFVIRNLLDLVAKTNYFQDIFATRPGNTGTGYARRILTVLQNDSKVNSNYCSFRKIANSVNYIADNEEEALHTAARVLNKMNDSGRATTNWCQLVIISVDGKTIDEKILYDALKNQDFETDSYGVKITEAGKTLLRLMSRFEYFACRYYPEYKSLFHKDNLVLDDSVDDKQCFKAENLIRKVIGYCLNCLKHMKAKDDKFNLSDDGPQYGELHRVFDYEIGPRPHSHAYHIVQKNIADLESYRCYLMSCHEQNILANPSNLEKEIFDKCLQSLLDQIMKSIWELLEYLYKNLDDYHDKEGNSYLLPSNKTSQFFDEIRDKYKRAKDDMSNNIYFPLVIE